MFWRSNCSCMTSLRGRRRPSEWIVFVFWRSSSARDLFQRRGRPRKWVVLMYQPIASVYFQSVAASSFLFICFISSFIWVYINRSVQNTITFAFYTNRSRLSCWDKFPMTIFWKFRCSRTIFKNEQREHIWDVNSGRFRIKNVTDRVHVVTQKINIVFSAYPASRDPIFIRDFCS